LLIDDCHGFRLEGKRYGFRTLIVDPTGKAGTEKVTARTRLLSADAA